MEKQIADKKKILRSYHFIEKDQLRKYLSGILSIDNDEPDWEKKRNQFINDISDFNINHIIQCNNEPISNIPEEPRYVSSMTPTGFINGKYDQDFMSTCHSKCSFSISV